jgi:DNA-binding transcriptional LysR family regulator
MLDVRRLRLLRELAHRGTIAAVADAVGYTASAVSQQLTALEREAGVPLLVRTGRRVTLTPAGADLAERTGAVLALLDSASAALASARGQLTGRLRIGAFPTAMRTVVPPALVNVGRAHPGLELLVTELDPAAMAAALRAGALDVGLLHEYDFVPAAPDPALHTEPLAVEVLYLASAETVPVDEPVRHCRDMPWIVGGPATLCHAMAIRACQAVGFTPRIRHHTDDFATVLALVAAGQGVAVVPRWGALDPPAGVVLTPLSIRRRTLVACRLGVREHPAVAAFVAALHAAATDS